MKICTLSCTHELQSSCIVVISMLSHLCQQCSIDALLEKTVKHMLFLQSVTKHADKLKDSTESKVCTCLYVLLFGYIERKLVCCG